MLVRSPAPDIPPARSRVPPQEIHAWLELTRHTDPKMRCKAVQALCPCHVKADDERIWLRLFELASDSDTRVRSQILHALGDGSPRSREAEVVAALQGMRDDPDLGLRRRVRRLLAHYRRTGKINIL